MAVEIWVPTVNPDRQPPGRLRHYVFARSIDPASGSAVGPLQLWTASGDAAEAEVARRASALIRHLENMRLGGRARPWLVSASSQGEGRARGDSAMLAVAAGDVVTRHATRSEDALARLYVTGTVAEGQGRAIGEAVSVGSIDGLAEKVAAIALHLEARPAHGPMLVALPAADLASASPDLGDALQALRSRGATVIGVATLADLLCAWIPPSAWDTSEFAQEFAGVQPPRAANVPQKSGDGAAECAAVRQAGVITRMATTTVDALRGHPAWVGIVALALASAGAVAWNPPHRVDLMAQMSAFVEAANALRDRLFGTPAPSPSTGRTATFNADTDCRYDAAAPSGEEAVCRQVLACDEAAGHPLDPALRAVGFHGGVAWTTLHDSIATRDAARRVCDAAAVAAPDSMRIQYERSRLLDAARDPATPRDPQAAALLETLAQRGYPMAVYSFAADAARDPGQETAARASLERLAAREPPVPGALIDLAGLIACGRGGPPDLQRARDLVTRASDLAQEYPADAVLGEGSLTTLARRMGEQLRDASDSTPPHFCQGP
jgi:hypothetical protein